MRTEPLLLSDLMIAIQKLPNPEKFQGGDNVSVSILDSLTKEIRHLLFRKRIFIREEKENYYWSLWTDIAINEVKK